LQMAFGPRIGVLGLVGQTSTSKAAVQVVELAEIRAAYKAAGELQPAEYPALPKWEDLSIEMRQAFTTVYMRGRTAGLLKRTNQTGRANRPRR
jgi:hypothetical protein